MSIRVVRGEVGAKDATTRTVIPTASQPRWPPFELIAETIATPRRRFPRHRHEGVEVLTYVIEGAASYEFGPGPPDPLMPGSTKLLTASTAVSHGIDPGKGHTVRWLAVVATLPSTTGAPARLQSIRVEGTEEQPDGTIVRRLVGPGSALTSAVGLECEVIEFGSAGASFRKVGQDRVAVCYALSGRGTVDNEVLDGGEAALLEHAAGVALQGRLGFHVVLISAPRGS